MTGAEESRTIYYGNRKSSQFYTRIYNKTALDPKHYPAPDEKVMVRVEIEIHRITGELILEQSFLDTEYAKKIYLQRLRRISHQDETGFLKQYFDNEDSFPKIRTVKRVIGDLEKSVEYVFKAYAPYIEAGLNSTLLKSKNENNAEMTSKGKKILAVLEAKENGADR